MKKTIISLFIGSCFLSTNAIDFLVVVDKEHNQYLIKEKGVEYSEWLFIDNTCVNDIEENDIYYGHKKEQTSICHDNFERTKTTTVVDENGKEEKIIETEYKSEYSGETKQEITGIHLENNCLDILNNDYSIGTDKYFISIKNNPEIVHCDMDINGGGWTLVTRLNTTDSTIRKWDDSFWTNNNTGDVYDSLDYMSSYKSESSFKDILLEFNYNKGVLISQFSNNSNINSYHELLHLNLSNSNIDFSRVYTNSSESSDFFGNILSFQVIGKNGDDAFRIWYNKVPKATCNQTGAIGTASDRFTNPDPLIYQWFTEAGYPTSYLECQENLYRSYLGTNYGGPHAVINDPANETLIGNPDFYTTDIINIYIK